jgi:hypothetical protein
MAATQMMGVVISCFWMISAMVRIVVMAIARISKSLCMSSVAGSGLMMIV